MQDIISTNKFIDNITEAFFEQYIHYDYDLKDCIIEELKNKKLKSSISINDVEFDKAFPTEKLKDEAREKVAKFREKQLFNIAFKHVSECHLALKVMGIKLESFVSNPDNLKEIAKQIVKNYKDWESSDRG